MSERLYIIYTHSLLIIIVYRSDFSTTPSVIAQTQITNLLGRNFCKLLLSASWNGDAARFYRCTPTRSHALGLGRHVHALSVHTVCDPLVEEANAQGATDLFDNMTGRLQINGDD